MEEVLVRDVLTRCDFSSAEIFWPGLMHTMNLHSLAQPPKEAFAVTEQIFLWHVEAQIWELMDLK